MDFRYSNEHEMFRTTMRDFCQKDILPLVDEAEEKEEFPVDLFRRMGQLGFFSMSFPEKVGGQGLDYFFDVIFTCSPPVCESATERHKSLEMNLKRSCPEPKRPQLACKFDKTRKFGEKSETGSL